MTKLEFKTITWSSPENLHPDVTDTLFQISTIDAQYQTLSEYVLSGTHYDGSAFELDDCRVFVALAKFINVGEYQRFMPSNGWVANIKTGYSAGDRIKMYPTNFGTDEFISCEVYLVWQSLTKFEIEVTDIFQADYKHYARWEAATANAVIDGTIATEVGRSCIDSVYSTVKGMGFYVNILRNRENTFVEHHEPIRLGWWNEDKNGQPLDQTMTVEIRNGLTLVDELSSYEDNEITIVLPYVAGEVPVSGVFTAFKEGQSDCNWREQVSLSRAEIATDVTSSQKDRLIWAPTRTLIDYAVDSAYKCEFTIPASEVETDGIYSLGCVLRIEDGAGNYVRTISLIQRRVEGNGFRTLPNCPMAGTILDYDKDLGNNNAQFTIPVDRYRTELTVDTAGFEAWAGTDSWIENSYAIGYSITDDDGNVYYESQVLKNEDNLFESTDDIEVVYSGTDIICKQTLRSQYINNQGILDVENKNIYVDWYVRANFSGTPPWTYYFTYRFTLRYRGYENVEASPIIESILFYDADTGEPITNLCNVVRVLIVAKLSDVPAVIGDHKMRVLIDKAPYGATFKNDQSLSEMDGYNSPQSFERLEEDPFEMAEEQFDVDGYGRAIVDVSYFLENEQWRVFVIADKV